MNMDVIYALKRINKTYRLFEHKGKSMTKEEVRVVLEYAHKKGYKTINDIPDNEVDNLIFKTKQQ